MQTNLKRGKAASRVRSAALSVAIAASASIAATFSFFAPSPALAACGGTHISGAHAASTGNGGTHATTSIAPSSGASSGGGSGGCANGSSATALRGLPTATSGRVVERGVAHAARSETHARTATTKTTNASAHTVKPAHHA